ncbi:hypothetical protein Cme02nite_55950 [Catellatospora methionotrophica]|uniref:Pyrrolo-quinoline quinone repeat domain-containing protein n=1 Tax=Catellatospora methionotrophica TaxID=121620 RepID=A0A8J3LFC9_9ACTN|nr:PQQ-binding-like beta-propeller repeat protein [Catellatospora methionotrophica]GIG17263.1 hypothetical protein Cme02nite_55950 [Catellatospora methionotrophica]
MDGYSTTGTVAVIDLGVGWREPHPATERPSTRRLLRPLAGAVAVAMMFALGGAARGRQLEELATIAFSPAGDFQIQNDMLLVRDADRLAAYSLADGTRRWDIALPGTRGTSMNSTPTVPGLMVTEMEDRETGRRSTYAVDVDTGAVLWQAEEMLSPYGEVAVAMWSTDQDRGSTQVVVRDVRTGQPRWSAQQVLPAIDYSTMLPDREPMRVWTLQATGELAERDLRDGRVLRRQRLDLAGAVPVDLVAFDGRLIVETRRGEQNTTALYSTADLSPILSTAPLVQRSDCGAFWCATSQPVDLQPTTSPMEIVDKATGLVRQRFPAGSFGMPTPAGLIVGSPEPGPTGLPAIALLDPATASPLFDVTGWDVYLVSTASTTVLARNIGTGPGQVAWLTPDGLDMAQLPVPADRCKFSPRVAACRSGPDTLTMWRRTR